MRPFIIALVALLVAECGSYPPWGVSYVYQRPVDVMVDVTNDLGMAILQDYSYSRSNFAFSPYGVSSVLAVLFEGARGESAKQIHNVMRLPWNQDIIRIGFRDMHMHLRSYFTHQGYLSGLSLNKNSSMLPEYERILRLYGYDTGASEPEPVTENATHVRPPTSAPFTTSPFDETTTATKQTTLYSSTPTASTQYVSTTEGVSSTVVTEPTHKEGDMVLPESGSTAMGTDGTTASTMGVSEQQTTVTTEDLMHTVTTPQTPKEPEDLSPAGSSGEHTEHVSLEETTPSEIAPTGSPTTLVTQIAHINETTSQGTSTEESPMTSPEQSVPTTSLPTSSESSTTTDMEHSTEQSDELTTTLPHESSTSEDEDPESSNEVTAITSVEETITEEGKPEDHAQLQVTSPATNTSSPAEEEPTSTTQTETSSEHGTSDTTSHKTTTDEATSTEGLSTSTASGLAEEGSEYQPATSPPITQEELDYDSATEAPETTETEHYADTTTPSTEEDTTPRPSPPSTSAPLPSIHIEPPVTYSYPKYDDSTSTTDSDVRLTPADITTPSNTKTTAPALPAKETISLFMDESATTNILSSNREPRTTVPPEMEATTEVDQDIPTTILFRDDVTSHRARTEDVKASNTSSPYVSEVEESFTEQTGDNVTSLEDHDRNKRDVSNNAFPDINLQLQNGMYDSQVLADEVGKVLPRWPFHVDGVWEVMVPVMKYTSEFPFAYIPRLQALALEYPLDDERYKLLLVLPLERRGLRQLIRDMMSFPLRDVYRLLRPTRVNVVIPTFIVEGFVVLTPTLQQLGIWDVFDPRRANLSGMSRDPDLYVKNVEQAITVVVRNYIEILELQTRMLAARTVTDRFIAAHPFLFFVMDSATHVALMAGKIVDPLTPKIY